MSCVSLATVHQLFTIRTSVDVRTYEAVNGFTLESAQHTRELLNDLDTFEQIISIEREFAKQELDLIIERITNAD